MGQFLKCRLQLFGIGASWQHLLETQMTGLCPRAAEFEFLGRGLAEDMFSKFLGQFLAHWNVRAITVLWGRCSPWVVVPGPLGHNPWVCAFCYNTSEIPGKAVLIRATRGLVPETSLDQ